MSNRRVILAVGLRAVNAPNFPIKILLQNIFELFVLLVAERLLNTTWRTRAPELLPATFYDSWLPTVIILSAPRVIALAY